MLLSVRERGERSVGGREREESVKNSTALVRVFAARSHRPHVNFTVKLSSNKLGRTHTGLANITTHTND